MKNKKIIFDLIFSLGEACSCSASLRNSFLQTASYPFDWLFGSTFIQRCNILCSDFSSFIRKEDLEYSFEEKSIKCSAYYNKYNDLTFNHDFLKELPFDDAYEQVKEKYNRRINRLLAKINESSTVLVVYIEIPSLNHIEITDSEIINGFKILKDKFGDKINLLYIKNTKNDLICEKFENGKITKISCDYKNYKSIHDNSVNASVIKKVLKDYRLNLPFSYHIKRKITKFLINLVPVKSLRHNLRKKHHL